MGNAQKREKIYKSPRRKLVRFFEKSRDQWKEKCREAKAGIRVLSNRVRFLEKGREKLKNKEKCREAKAGIRVLSNRVRFRAVCGCSAWDITSSRDRRRRRRSGCGSSVTRFRSERRSAW